MELKKNEVFNSILRVFILINAERFAEVPYKQNSLWKQDKGNTEWV